MTTPTRKGAKNWSYDEWDLLFRAFPPIGRHPSQDELVDLARQIGRSADAVGWAWEDAASVIQGRPSTSSQRQQEYLRLRGWLQADDAGLSSR